VGAGGDHQVDRRHAVVADASQLALRFVRGCFDIGIDRNGGQHAESIHALFVVYSRLGGVAGLEQKRRAGGDLLRVEHFDHRVETNARHRAREEERPRRIVDQQHATRCRSERSGRGA
jgi:hypothetical protein